MRFMYWTVKVEIGEDNGARWCYQHQTRPLSYRAEKAARQTTAYLPTQHQ